MIEIRTLSGLKIIWWLVYAEYSNNRNNKSRGHFTVFKCTCIYLSLRYDACMCKILINRVFCIQLHNAISIVEYKEYEGRCIVYTVTLMMQDSWGCKELHPTHLPAENELFLSDAIQPIAVCRWQNNVFVKRVNPCDNVYRLDIGRKTVPTTCTQRESVRRGAAMASQQWIAKWNPISASVNLNLTYADHLRIRFDQTKDLIDKINIVYHA